MKKYLALVALILAGNVFASDNAECSCACNYTGQEVTVSENEIKETAKAIAVLAEELAKRAETSASAETVDTTESAE